MFISTIPAILKPQALDRVRDVVSRARFVSGHVSGGSPLNKLNLELAPDSDEYIEAIGIVEAAVREHPEFNLVAFPRYMTRPIISRYQCGMYYKEHVDFPVMGFMTPNTRRLSPVGSNYVRSDLSMTLFLTPPHQYKGGELCFDAPDGPARIKLPPGDAVVYPTGARHSVSEITEGERVAAVFWIQSMFPVETERRLVHDAHRLMTLLQANRESPEYLLAQDHFYNLFRLLAKL